MATNDLIPTALVATGIAPAAIPKPAPRAVQKDPFAAQAGPDVSFSGEDGPTQTYAVFQVDQGSKKLKVTIVDGEGRILRSIPPGSVAEMISAMNRYRP